MGFKADFNGVDANGTTALHLMAGEGKIDMVQFLLKVGADVKARDKVSLKRETLTHAMMMPFICSVDGYVMPSRH